MTARLLFLSFPLWLLLAADAWAQSEVGHYQPGVVNAKDFVVPEPGWYYCQYDTYYHSDRFNDQNGKRIDSVTIGATTVPVKADVDWLCISPTVVWTSPWELLGGSYAAFVSVPLQSNSVGAEVMGRRFGFNAQESNYGLGDVQVQPVWIGWKGKNWELSAAYGFFAPTGAYSLGSSNNVGLGFWSHYLQGSLGVYLTDDQAVSAYVTATYEMNEKNSGEAVTGGNHFCLEYSISETFGDRFELAFCGSDIWQTSQDHGSGVTWDRGIMDEAHAIGGQFAIWLIPDQAQISLNGMWEYDTRDRFRGYFAMLNLLIVVGTPTGHRKAP